MKNHELLLIRSNARLPIFWIFPTQNKSMKFENVLRKVFYSKVIAFREHKTKISF